MQLKPEKAIRGALLAATATLLGHAVTATAAEGDWSFDSAILFYSETDRVSAIEPVFSARRELADDGLLDLKIVFDALTGASASGALPSSQVQTFTRPSGNGYYDIQPGETPLDDTFRDTRGSFTASWLTSLNPDWKMTLGGNVSTEYDFQSLAANAMFSRDFNKRNTTLSFGASLEADSISPVGGVPTPLMRMIDQGSTGVVETVPDDPGIDTDDVDFRSSDDSKTVSELLVGLTQIIDRNTVAQLNYNFSVSDGYLTDPYKLTSVINTSAGASYGDPLYHVYENRPDSRTKHAVYAGIKRWFDGDILNASYRFMTDDWGIQSHTLDVRYRFDLDTRHYIEPHFRYYTQTAADFYRVGLLDTDVLPAEVSSDYRIGQMDAATLGAQYGYRFNNDSELRVRLEYYQQMPGSSGASDDRINIGTQQNHDLYPTVDAALVQFSYSFRF
jgi:hypothetical protein